MGGLGGGYSASNTTSNKTSGSSAIGGLQASFLPISSGNGSGQTIVLVAMGFIALLMLGLVVFAFKK